MATEHDVDLDLDAYFDRIGYRGPRTPTIDVLHAITAAHTMTVPFENLDVLLQRPIELHPASVFEKVVTQRRGGYCFELNGLLLQVLGAIGFTVTPLSARVRLGRTRDFVPTRTHLFVRVEIDGERWITDVGVGGASLTSAIRYDSADEQSTAHELRRIVDGEGGVRFHQVRYGETWNDVYELTGEPMPFIDRVVANWYTSTHPQSHFRAQLMAARALPDGRRLGLLNRELTVRARGGQATTTAVDSAEQLLEVLATSFGLHFPPGTRFRAPDGGPEPWPT